MGKESFVVVLASDIQSIVDDYDEDDRMGRLMRRDGDEWAPITRFRVALEHPVVVDDDE